MLRRQIRKSQLHVFTHSSYTSSVSSPSRLLFTPSPIHFTRTPQKIAMSTTDANKKVVQGLDERGPIKRDRHPPWYPPMAPSAALAAAAAGGEEQPEAAALPTGADQPLRVMNSLTEHLEVFQPLDGNYIKWYTCGPTVYDLSHMGHARAYLTFDIIRRIMEDYFHYDIIYQMNITDIDDKIIKRARINKLLSNYKEELLAAHKGEVSDGLLTAFRAFTAQALEAAAAGLASKKEKLSVPLPPSAPSRAKTEREEKLLELDLKLTQLAETKEKIAAAEAALAAEHSAAHFENLFAAAGGVNGDLLDEQKGHLITDHKIYEAHARKYEKLFFDDMERLGVREPDLVTRVTEYVPQVVAFIEKIMANGFAYKGESSIFFDTAAFAAAGHDYPKLKGGDRNAATTEEEMAEGEGALSKAVDGEKRNANDFALWKFSKPGEPSWPAPWGAGRPGWHIECSVMASDVLGENMDIHSGGWDLKFPHHDNECAQSEACNLHHQWVNYFLHCGHLHIKGLKMSKSLKNFITIQQALDELGVSPRTMRLLFLANSWNKPMNFSDQSLDEAKEKERVLRSFFGSVEVILRADYWAQAQGATARDRSLVQQLKEAQQAVHAALKNNFDTPTALTALMNLVSATNQYMAASAAETDRASATLVRKVSRYITHIFQVFGVVDGNDFLGFTAGGGGGGAAAAGAGGALTDEAALVKVTDALTEFRDAVREAAKAAGVAAAILPLCDHVRDEQLADAGIRLEDKPGGGPTTWKRDDPVLLRQEREARKQQVAEQARRKLENQSEVRRKLVEKWAQFTTAPAAYLQAAEAAKPTEQQKYKLESWDSTTGLPTEMRDGSGAVSDKDLKKLQKDLAKYEKGYKEFQEKGGETWLQEQQREHAAMLAELEKLK